MLPPCVVLPPGYDASARETSHGASEVLARSDADVAPGLEEFTGGPHVGTRGNGEARRLEITRAEVAARLSQSEG